jgi:cold shock protein
MRQTTRALKELILAQEKAVVPEASYAARSARLPRENRALLNGPNGPTEILLHVTCLRAGGYQTAFEGARIACEVLRWPCRLQVLRILSMDDSTAIHPSQLPMWLHVHVIPESDWVRATLKWFNRVRGFGFLTRREGTPDIFVHMETLRRSGFTELRSDQIVQVRHGQGSKACMAVEMRSVAQMENGMNTI